MTALGDDGAEAATARRSAGEVEAKRLLARLTSGCRRRLARSADEAARSAEEIGFPVVVKVASPEILHKSDVGGVALNVLTAEQARAAFERVTGSARRARPDARVEAALVEASCRPGGVELIVGVVEPALRAGRDVRAWRRARRDPARRGVRLAPITRADALEMLGELRGARLLDGVRGARPGEPRGAGGPAADSR